MMSHEEPDTPEVPETVVGEPPAVQEVVTPVLRDEEAPESTGERLRTQVAQVLEQVEATPIVGDVYDWVRAFALGLKDTAESMLDEGRESARRAQNEAWRRFDDKTKYRRRK